MNKEVSANFRLSIAFALVNIPVCLLAGFGLSICSLYLWGDLTLLFTKGIVEESLWGTLVMFFFCILCFVLEFGFIWLIFFWVNPQKERFFWVYSISLFSIVFGMLIISSLIEHNYDNMLITGLFYCAFYITGSVFALTEVNKLIKVFNEKPPLSGEI